jgi:predicted alpha/beta superfamily hydrolase
MTTLLRTYTLILCIFFSLAIGACATAQTPTAVPSTVTDATTVPVVTIPDSELRTLESSATGRVYDLYVRLPSGYTLNAKKQYPILYVLDGQWDFKLLDSIYGGLYYDQFVPEMIIVGITYSGEYPDYETLRAMDYTPVYDNAIPGSGDADKFLAFFKDELIPFVETNYRVDPSQRTLMGSSFGGLFTLYAMFTDSTLFSGYVSASPAVTYGARAAFKQEVAYASQHQDLSVRLFLSVGELEPLSYPVQEFMQVINERGYSGLEMQTMVIEGERHAGNKPEAFNRGLRFIFQGK